MSQPLLLWDIDGTLLQNPGAGEQGGSHLQEFQQAVAAASGKEDLQPPDKIDGSTDFAVIHSILENSGFSPREAAALFIPALQELERITTDQELIAASRQLVPGADQTLAALASEYLSTYATGNSPYRAQAKTAYFQIDHYLDPSIGGFGWWTARRADFVARAISLAQDKFPDRDFIPVVIGDTPADIASAQELGVRSVGVAAGIFSRQQLQQSGPDLVLEDLSTDQLSYFLRQLARG